MNPKEKINFMINALQLAKEEIEYAEKYQKEQKNDDKFYCYGHFGGTNRTPNGTVIRENLKTVGRMANIVSSEITLSPYCNEIYKK